MIITEYVKVDEGKKVKESNRELSSHVIAKSVVTNTTIELKTRM